MRTSDSKESVIDWYRANLKDQSIDFDINPESHHFLTHNGAGVEVSQSRDRQTEISLVWDATKLDEYAQEAIRADPKMEASPDPRVVAGVSGLYSPPKRAAATITPPPHRQMPFVAPTDAQRNEIEGSSNFKLGHYYAALAAWEKAAAGGDSTASLLIGTMFDTGKGLAQSPANALIWYQKSADQGNPIAQFNVAVMYDSGIGVERDPAVASHWYASAADRGHGRAAYNLGLMYDAGNGVPKDARRALHYFRLASRLGISAAQEHIATLTKDAALGVGLVDVSSANERKTSPEIENGSLTRDVEDTAKN